MNRAYRSPAGKNDILYGLHTVMAVLSHEPHRCKKLFIARREGERSLIELAEKKQLSYELLDREGLNKRFGLGSECQGVALLCSPYSYCKLEDLLLGDRKRLLFLDSWQDAANLGRAARAALCFGADGLIILKDRSAQITPAAEKSAVGALSQIPVARITNMAQGLEKAKDHNFFVYGAFEDGRVSLRQCDFSQKVALVIGQEGEGIRQLVKKSCDVMVKIPMSSESICLNAADTALIFLYELSMR